MLFGLFEKRRGCLSGKTQAQKIKFFESLAGFARSKEEEHNLFFREQYLDLLPHEKREFENWLTEDLEVKKRMKSLLDVIEKLLKEKK